MNELSQFIGRFHPVLVHLPIGILLLALMLETASRTTKYQDVQKSMPFVLLLGSVAALFSCLTGWFLSQNGEYENNLVSRHQWLGIGVAIVSFSAFWLKIRQRSMPYLIAYILLLPGILLTGHWGITLTHGEGYLTKSASLEAAKTESEATSDFFEIPDVEVSPPLPEAVSSLQKMGVVVLPVGKEQPFLSLNFINAPEITPAIRQALEPLQENAIWLKLSGTALTDSSLAFFSNFKNLTKLHLDRTDLTDQSFVHLQKMERLVYLNLVGTKVTAQGVGTLGSLPNLRKIFLYQTSVMSGDSAILKTKLPRVQIDMGGYEVPILPTDTTFLPEKK